MTENEKVAQRIATLIDTGVLKNGQKIPSLRNLSEQLSVSVNTVREAYWKLESRRYIEAVPQSGYYVRSLQPPARSPEVPPRELDPREVTLCQVYGALKNAEEDKKIVQLGVALLSRDFWPEKKIARFYQKALQKHPGEVFDYMLPPGHLPLRQQISLVGMHAGLQLSPDDLIITNGCQEALFLAIMTLCRPGDSVVVESPGYFNLLSMLDRLGVNAVEVPCTEEEGINLDVLSYVLENNPVKAVFIISNFSNPLGTVLSTERKKRLLSILERFDVPLIEDDIYGDLSHGARPDACKAFDADGRVIYCSSFSKTISPGLRLGWIAPGRWFDEVIALKRLLDIGSPSLNQVAVAMFLREGGYERHLRKIRQGLKETVAAVRREVLERFPAGTRVSDPQGGFFLWVTLAEGTDTMRLYYRALEENILIAPGCLFTRKNDFSCCMRLYAGAWGAEERRAIARLGALLEA